MRVAMTGGRLSAVTALVVLAIGAGAGQAAASPVSVTIPFDCNMPIIGHVNSPVVFTADVPATSSTGDPFTIGAWSATVDLPHVAFDWLYGPFGAHFTDGTMDTTIDVDSTGTTQFPVTGTIARTAVPDMTGPDLLIPATGSGPQATGPVTRVAAGATATLHLAWYDANGDPVLLDPDGPDPQPLVLTVPCAATGDTTIATPVVTDAR